jgi:tripartite-type tricarboxylate transporter receptor subunit TctC
MIVTLLVGCGGAESADDASGTSAPDDGEDTDAEPTDGDDATDESDADPQLSFADGDTVRLVTPTGPGGGYDTQARMLQPHFEAALRERTGLDISVQVENVPGGGHRVGMEQVAHSDPDGLTILYAGTSRMVGHQVLGGAEYDARDMTPLGRLTTSQQALFVRQDLDLPERNFEGLVQRSQDEPLLLGHIGIEPEFELMSLLLAAEGWDLQLDHVVVDSTGDLMSSLLRSDIEVGSTTGPAGIPFVEDSPDELEALVILGCDPEFSMPDTPTIVEEGIPAANEICSAAGTDTRMFMAPPGLDEATAVALSDALEVAMANEDFIAQLRDTGFETMWLGPEGLASGVADLVETWETYREELPQL